MSLWYSCLAGAAGFGWARAHFARYDIGVDVVLCAPGPSMEPIARQPGVMVAALTKAYPKIIPDIWFGMDTPECYDRRIWAESFIKVAQAGPLFTGMDIETAAGPRFVRDFPHVYFADIERGLPVADIFNRRGHEALFGWYDDTLGVALHCLVWMGARRIFLNGFDLRDVAGRDYADGIDKALSSQLRARNQHLFRRQVVFLRQFVASARAHGIAVYSSTLGSPINAFMPYRSLNGPMGLLQQIAREDLPTPAPLLHTFETPAGLKFLDHQRAVAAAGGVLPFSRRGIREALARSKRGKVASNAITVKLRESATIVLSDENRAKLGIMKQELGLNLPPQPISHRG